MNNPPKSVWPPEKVYKSGRRSSLFSHEFPQFFATFACKTDGICNLIKEQQHSGVISALPLSSIRSRRITAGKNAQSISNLLRAQKLSIAPKEIPNLVGDAVQADWNFKKRLSSMARATGRPPNVMTQESLSSAVKSSNQQWFHHFSSESGCILLSGQEESQGVAGTQPQRYCECCSLLIEKSSDCQSSLTRRRSLSTSSTTAETTGPSQPGWWRSRESAKSMRVLAVGVSPIFFEPATSVDADVDRRPWRWAASPQSRKSSEAPRGRTWQHSCLLSRLPDFWPPSSAGLNPLDCYFWSAVKNRSKWGSSKPGPPSSMHGRTRQSPTSSLPVVGPELGASVGEGDRQSISTVAAPLPIDPKLWDMIKNFRLWLRSPSGLQVGLQPPLSMAHEKMCQLTKFGDDPSSAESTNPRTDRQTLRFWYVYSSTCAQPTSLCRNTGKYHIKLHHAAPAHGPRAKVGQTDACTHRQTYIRALYIRHWKYRYCRLCSWPPEKQHHHVTFLVAWQSLLPPSAAMWRALMPPNCWAHF